MNLHPTSALYGLGFLPDFTVYHEVRPTAPSRTAADAFSARAHEQGVHVDVRLRPFPCRADLILTASPRSTLSGSLSSAVVGTRSGSSTFLSGTVERRIKRS